jgi:hypothetical protein
MYDEAIALYHHPNFCNEQRGTETLLTKVFKQTQWEEYSNHLEGEISADIPQEVLNVGNLHSSSIT